MSGHNKWSTIKHKKAKTDAKRGKVFTKIIRELTVAARMGGGDVEMNPRLRKAVANAKASNMPKDTMQRAIDKGAGNLDGVNYEDVVYEGYGPGGVAVMVEAVTDNRNRTTAEMRLAFGKYGGNLGSPGSVGYLFERVGQISGEAGAFEEDDLMMLALEAGAEDLTLDDGTFTITTEAGTEDDIAEKLQADGVQIDKFETALIPSTTVELSGKKATSMMKIIDMLEDNDDVQNVFSNFDIDDETAAELAG
jgi:YebC/PmpR family DNA-binding regulatory protein